MLRGEEVTRAIELLRTAGHLDEDARVVHVVLEEPEKSVIDAYRPGDPIDRVVRVLVARGPALDLLGAVVAVTAAEVRKVHVHQDMRPALLFGEALNAI